MGKSTFPNKGNPVFTNGPKSLTKNLFYVIEFLKILCQPRNYFQKLYKASKLVYLLMITYAENYFHH